MADVSAKTKQVMEKLCSTMTNMEIKYQRDDENMSVKVQMIGKDLPMEGLFMMKDPNQILLFLSDMPFRISEEKRLDAAIAVNCINSSIADGFFDYDIKTGRIIFRMTASYRDVEVGTALFEYMIVLGFQMIDEYNDKLLMLDKGIVSLEQFIESI